MRRLLALSLVFAPVSLACATSDPAPVYVSINYQVRCIDCNPRAADDSAHTITALDGADGFDVACTTQQLAKGRLVTFSANLVDSAHPSKNYGIKILQADVEKSDPGSSCRVQVVEGSNTYEGRCGSAAPSADVPCQLNKLKVSNGVVTGKLLCDAIPNRNDSSVTRYLVAPGSTDPISLEVHGCPDL
jgi:hypothetical protein